MFGLRFLFDPLWSRGSIRSAFSEKTADTKLFCLSDFVRQHAEAEVHRVVRVIFLNIAEGQGQHMEQAMFCVGRKQPYTYSHPNPQVDTCYGIGSYNDLRKNAVKNLGNYTCS